MFITNNSQPDPEMKQMVHFQINRKIYTKPGMGISNTHVTPKKGCKQYVMKVNQNPKPLKLNVQHFTTKQMEIGDIDVNMMDRPMQCSTPNPNLDTTILAGHLDYAIETGQREESESTSTEATDSDDFLQQFLLKHLKTKKENDVITAVKHEVKSNNTEKESYCNDWVKKENGISTNNFDTAPSLFDSTVDISPSLLDITSVSCNVPPVKKMFPTTKGSVTTSVAKHSNTKFM